MHIIYKHILTAFVSSCSDKISSFTNSAKTPRALLGLAKVRVVYPVQVLVSKPGHPFTEDHKTTRFLMSHFSTASRQLTIQQVCVPHRPSADSVALPAYAAVLQCRCCWALAPAIDRYLLPAGRSAANPSARRFCGRTIGQTDERTLRHFIGPVRIYVYPLFSCWFRAVD